MSISGNAAKTHLVRLNKYLVSQGHGSRREVNEMVEKGFIRLNGSTATHERRVNPGTDVLQVNLPTAWQHPKTTVIFHKPLGIVSCQPEEERGHIPAVQLLTAENYHMGSSKFQNISPSKREPYQLSKMAVAGRLDINSTGLLVFTQCGQTASQIIGPDSKLEKEYLVRLSQPWEEGGVKSKRVDPYFDLTQVDDDTSERGSIIRERLEQLRAGICCTGDMLQLVSVDVLNAQQLRIVLRRGLKQARDEIGAVQVGRECRAIKDPRAHIDANAVSQNRELAKAGPEAGIGPGQIGGMGIAESQFQRQALADMRMDERQRLLLRQGGDVHAENLTRLHGLQDVWPAPFGAG